MGFNEARKKHYSNDNPDINRLLDADYNRDVLGVTTVWSPPGAHGERMSTKRAIEHLDKNTPPYGISPIPKRDR